MLGHRDDEKSTRATDPLSQKTACTVRPAPWDASIHGNWRRRGGAMEDSEWGVGGIQGGNAVVEMGGVLGKAGGR
jgi:hypothetical protein